MKKIILLSPFFLMLFVSCASSTPHEQTTEEKKAEIYYTQGTSDLVKKDYLQALTNLLKAKELSPKDSMVRNNLGMAYYFKGQVELAMTELKKAISLNESNSDAKVNLATIYFERKKYKDARQMYNEVLSNITYENQFRTYYNIALLDLAEGDRKSAFENLDRSLKEKDDYCIANFKLGELYSEEYKFKDALVSFQKASKGLCVSEPAPHYFQAVTLINLDRKTQAKKKFQEIITKFPATQYHKMASGQLNKLNQTSANDEEGLTIDKQQTEVISDSPKF
jgi:Tfp pilus assembly protein PilF